MKGNDISTQTPEQTPGGSQSPGLLFTQRQDCLEWEQLLPHATPCWWQSCTAQTWMGKGFDWWFFFFLYLCLFEMGWKDLKRSAHCHRAWATMCTVTRTTILLTSKFSCQFKFPSVKPSHIAPLVEGSTFSGGNSEQSCSSKMPFGGAPPLSKGMWRVHKDYSPWAGEVHTTTVLPLSPSLLHWWVQLNEELKDEMQEEVSRIMWLCLDFLHQADHGSLLHFSIWKN